MTEVAEVAKKAELRVLQPNRFKGLEFANAHYSVTVEEGTKVEDLESKDFWAHVAVHFRPYDEISIRIDDESFFAKAVVVACSTNYAKVRVYEFIDLSAVEKIDPVAMETHEIKWRGPQHRFAVIRKADGAVLIQELDKDAAIVWLRSHLQANKR